MINFSIMETETGWDILRAVSGEPLEVAVTCGSRAEAELLIATAESLNGLSVEIVDALVSWGERGCKGGIIPAAS